MATTELRLPIQIDTLRTTLLQHGVIKASVFGSYARGNQTADSDLDLLVGVRDNVSLFDLLE